MAAPISVVKMSDNGVRTNKRHEEFFYRDGNICFLVGDTLFRLHRYFFERESEYFCTFLSPPANEDGSPNDPHVIRDVTSEEFAQFVWVWYNPYYSFSKQDKTKWITILRLASKWRFDEIRQLAIRQLEKLKLDPIEKILLYKEHSVDGNLIIPSYAFLCKRKEHLSPEEGKILGMETVLKLASAREQAIKSAVERGLKTPTTASVGEDVLAAIIAELFGILTPHQDDQTVRVEGQTTSNGGASSCDSLDTEGVSGKQQAGRLAKGGGKKNPK